jgi:hypothetical protein
MEFRCSPQEQHGGLVPKTAPYYHYYISSNTLPCFYTCHTLAQSFPSGSTFVPDLVPAGDTDWPGTLLAPMCRVGIL